MNKNIYIIGVILLSSVLVGCTFPFGTPIIPPPTSHVGYISPGTTETGIIDTGATSSISTGALTHITANGTEPFWAFEQTATGAKFSRPGAESVEETLYTSIETHSGIQILITAVPISSGSVINLILTPSTCNNGMSDHVYSYNAKLTFPSEVLNGCAE